MRALLAAALLLAAGLAVAAPASAVPQCKGVTYKGEFTGACSPDPACPSASGGNGVGVYVLGSWFACVEAQRIDPTLGPCIGLGVGTPSFTGVCVRDPNCRGPDGSPGIGTYQNGNRTGCVYF